MHGTVMHAGMMGSYMLRLRSRTAYMFLFVCLCVFVVVCFAWWGFSLRFPAFPALVFSLPCSPCPCGVW
jgi:hypothetical protein